MNETFSEFSFLVISNSEYILNLITKVIFLYPPPPRINPKLARKGNKGLE